MSYTTKDGNIRSNFIARDYIKFDKPGKQMIADFLSNFYKDQLIFCDKYDLDKDDIFGEKYTAPDMIYQILGSLPQLAEAEIKPEKRHWKLIKETGIVHLLHRKLPYVEYAKQNQMEFTSYLFNDNGTMIVATTGEVMAAAPKKVIRVKRIDEDGNSFWESDTILEVALKNTSFYFKKEYDYLLLSTDEARSL